jgi:hypothetical protein
MQDKKLFNSEKFYSQRKFNMWKRCEREYFLHYYTAYGEYDYRESTEENFQIHLLKSIKSEDELLTQLLRESLSELFFKHTEIDDLLSIILKKMSIVFNKMFLGEFEQDHNCPLLYRFYYGGVDSMEEYLHQFENRVRQVSLKLLDNKLFRRFFYQDKLNFYQPDHKVPFIMLREIKVYGNLILMIKLEKKFYFISFDGKDHDFIRFFHLYYGVNKMHLPVEMIKSVVVDINRGDLIILDDTDVNISTAIGEIGENFSQIPEYDFETDYRLIPKTFDSSKCQICRFKELCL